MTSTTAGIPIQIPRLSST